MFLKVIRFRSNGHNYGQEVDIIISEMNMFSFILRIGTYTKDSNLYYLYSNTRL
jgi:hypothetical protein